MKTEPDEKTETRKRYHTPEISVYGTLTQLTQSMQPVNHDRWITQVAIRVKPVLNSHRRN